MQPKLVYSPCLNAFLLLAFSGLAFAQGLASFQGTVGDPTGAVVPSAKITATQVNTGLSRSVTTDAQGNYIIPALAPTAYSLTVEAPGFRTFTQRCHLARRPERNAQRDGGTRPDQ